MNTIRKESIVIFDEIDTLMDPSKNTLNNIISSNVISKYMNLYTSDVIEQIYDIAYYHIMNRHAVDFKTSIDEYINVHSENIPRKKYIEHAINGERIDVENLTSTEVNKICTICNFIVVMKHIFGLVYNEQYGLPTDSSHIDKFCIVPYSHINTPIHQ